MKLYRLTVTLMITVSLCACANTSMEAATTEAQVLPTVQEVDEINRYVNGLISYGLGPQVEGRNPCEREILNAGEGHCGMYAYLFVKELSRRGYDNAVVYDIRSTYWGSNTAAHSVVEVTTQDGLFVYDPTYGIYYRTDIETLTNCESVEVYACGKPSEESYYQTSQFFTEKIQLVCYEDVRNSYDLNLLEWYDHSVSSGVQTIPELSQEISYDATMEPGSIVLSFEEPIEFYRMEMGFDGKVPELLNIEFKIRDENGEMVAIEGRFKRSAYHVSFQLEEPHSSSKIILKLTNYEELPYINYLNLYQ